MVFRVYKLLNFALFLSVGYLIQALGDLSPALQIGSELVQHQWVRTDFQLSEEMGRHCHIVLPNLPKRLPYFFGLPPVAELPSAGFFLRTAELPTPLFSEAYKYRDYEYQQAFRKFFDHPIQKSYGLILSPGPDSLMVGDVCPFSSVAFLSPLTPAESVGIELSPWYKSALRYCCLKEYQIEKVCRRYGLTVHKHFDLTGDLGLQPGRYYYSPLTNITSSEDSVGKVRTYLENLDSQIQLILEGGGL